MAQLDACKNLDSKIYRRAKHVITEIARTQQAAEAIREGDWSLAGKLMYQSHESMRDDFEISCPEIDLLVEIARELGESAGVFGSRLTGGGFGGCTVSLVNRENATEVASTIMERYTVTTNLEASVFSSRPAVGAHAVAVKLESQ